ncbi:MAG: L-alanine-DL-glutamate epimerase (EC [uncultured Gemmatimonadaceae bacterium]|uniref:Dipeptide epimerase n=1 Tax=uncultured Gemmatimonadaceae bacterium TaxID=246130 RepID=A0A6J4M7P8_9BACT|nr:MAG: L-alanine-DL-glutamate epimerase (EC [uncultured Gemmatimonadaceae bacterium]
MHITHELLHVRTRHPFAIARGVSSDYTTITVRVTAADGAEGWGEAAPNRFYGETTSSVAAVLPQLAAALEGLDPWHLDEAERRMNAAIRHNGAAKSAVSAALHDLAAKRLGVPLYRLWGLDPARAPRSSFTIGIPPNDAELRARVAEADEYPVLKVKLGSDRDEAILRTVREAAPHKTLRVDANAAWTPKHAARMAHRLADVYGVEFLEQPVAAHDLDGLRFVRERSPIPVVADESCVTSADIAGLVGRVDGINIKLAKCGGLREAVRMVHAARAHGLLVMAGCMIETSLGIAAAAHLAPLLDYVDLDGAALLADDPYVGPSIAGGVVRLPDGPGLGVTRR